MSATLMLALLAAAPAAEEPPVGFVVHPHAALYEELGETPANAEIANVFLWRMEDQEQEVPAFDWAEAWLQRLYETDRAAYPILDTSVFHSGAGWRQAKTAAAGENLVDFAGETRSISSLFSPIFRNSVRNYIDHLTAWVAGNDPEGRIAGYVDGAEWFMPGTADYSELAFEAFRPWLEKRYGGLDDLNAAWASDFAGWDAVEPPRGYLLGDDYVGLRTAGFTPLDIAWVSPRFEVTGGARYAIRADSLHEGVPEGLCALHLVCYDEGGNRIAYYGDGQFIWNEAPSGEWTELRLVTQAPPDAVEAEFRMRLMGPGHAVFRGPDCRAWPDGAGMLPAPGSADAWRLVNGGWRPEGGPAARQLTVAQARELPDAATPAAPGGAAPADGRFHLAAHAGPMPCGNAALAWNDWITFCYEAMAGWLNECAAHIKAQDPGRDVLSYIGSVFGTHCIPDFNMYWQRVDISLANSPDVDVNGIQMCIAGDDVTYATHLVDIARKYGKPIYATDLVDFPFGLYSGFGAIYRGTLAAAQHGMGGVFWYTWREAIPDFTEYSYSLMLTADEQKRLVRDTKSAIAALEGYQLETDIALVLPIAAQSVAMPTGYAGDVLNRAGWYHLLLDAGYAPDIYTPYELEKRGRDALAGYGAVVLPDAYMLPRGAYAAIEAFREGGGIVIADGAPPMMDLSGGPLRAPGDPDVLTREGLRNHNRSLAEALTDTEGVAWEGYLVGRAYWGPVRRWREDGNTPPPFMQLDRTPRTELLRTAWRQRLSETLGGLLPRHCRLLPGQDRVHMAVWRDTANAEDLKLFLVNLTPGRAHPQQVALPEGLRSHAAEAWLDFDGRQEARIEGGVLTVPGFAHAAIVHLTP